MCLTTQPDVIHICSEMQALNLFARYIAKWKFVFPFLTKEVQHFILTWSLCTDQLCKSHNTDLFAI